MTPGILVLSIFMLGFLACYVTIHRRTHEQHDAPNAIVRRFPLTDVDVIADRDDFYGWHADDEVSA